MVDVPSTFGALLVGGLVATGFTGAVTVQTLAYFKFYPTDFPRIKLLVFAVWLLDFCHAIFVSLSLWDYFITNYGDSKKIDSIPWSLALTIVFTAILTFLVHCFFAHRIFKLSKRNWYITIPLGVLACMRLCAASLTTAKMIILRSLSAFVREFHWSFTLGLALSSTLDIFITGLLCYFLSSNRKETSSMHHVIDALILYTFENGSLTCAATIVSMVCWLIAPTNLIFMGLHFVISKLYANSLLATLNTRKELQRGPGRTEPLGLDERFKPIVFPESFESRPRNFRDTLFALRPSQTHRTRSRSPMLHINVEKTVELTIDDGPPTAYTV